MAGLALLLTTVPVPAADFDASGSFRVRHETLDGQFRPGFDAYDDLTSLRTLLRAQWRSGDWLLAGELQDSRVYDTDARSALTTGEVNALEVVQANLTRRFAEPLGSGSSASIQAGRFSMNLGSRRLVASDDYRNTTNSYTGLRADVATAGGSALTLHYTLPNQRRPGDFEALRRNAIQIDRESSDARLWGGLFTRSGLPGKLQLELGYVGFQEADSPSLATRNRNLDSFSVRLLRNPSAKAWDFELEGILQSGRSRTGTAVSAPERAVDAQFLHAELGRSLDHRWKPRLALEIDYASGESPANDVSRFDTLFGMRTADFGPSGIYGAVGRTNMQALALRLDGTPTKRVEAHAAWRALWAADGRDSFATSGVRDASGASGRFAGHQFETRVRYWVMPQRLRSDFFLVRLMKGGLMRDAPNAPGHGDTLLLSLSLTLDF